jgi:hypothetical protein
MDDLRPVPATSNPPTSSSSASFIGRGFAWPMGVDHTGSLALTHGEEDLDRSIRIVLATAPGERVMRPQFGCKIWDLMFEPVTANLMGAMKSSVKDALARWEPRVQVNEVRVLADDDDASLVRILVSYTVRATNDKRNLVYPFYVIPREEN